MVLYDSFILQSCIIILQKESFTYIIVTFIVLHYNLALQHLQKTSLYA
jgi:hypothetical protein